MAVSANLKQLLMLLVGVEVPLHSLNPGMKERRGGII